MVDNLDGLEDVGGRGGGGGGGGGILEEGSDGEDVDSVDKAVDHVVAGVDGDEDLAAGSGKGVVIDDEEVRRRLLGQRRRRRVVMIGEEGEGGLEEGGEGLREGREPLSGLEEDVFLAAHRLTGTAPFSSHSILLPHLRPLLPASLLRLPITSTISDPSHLVYSSFRSFVPSSFLHCQFG